MKGAYDPAVSVADNLTEALRGLGDTAEEVAAKLQDAGVTGDPWDSRANPVCRYLGIEFPNDVPIVDTWSRTQRRAPKALLTARGTWSSGHHDPVQVTLAITEFFDEARKGRWPELTEH